VPPPRELRANDNGGCELALLELTSELAALALETIAPLRERKNIDPISTKSTTGHILIVRQEGIAFSAIPKYASF
jgi:hypothetical protein